MAKDYTINVTVNGKDEASGVFEKVGNSATKWLAAAAIAAASAAAGFQGLMVSADFEQQMSSVQAVAMATAEEMTRMKDAAVEWGASTAFSASQVAMGMEELAKAGLAPNEILESIGGMLDLAAAGGLELAEAANIAAVALNTFKLPASEITHVGDVLALTANRTATDVREIGVAMQYVGPIASALNMSLEEVTAAMGLMAAAGIRGSMAGTSLRQIVTSLISPTDEAAKVLDKYGISIYDAEGQMIPFVDIIRQFEPVVAKGAEGVAALTKVFGDRGTPGMVAVVQQGAEAFNEAHYEAIAVTGAMQEMAKIRMDNFRGSVEELKGAMESLAISVFGTGDGDQTSVKGAMRKVMDEAITPLIRELSEASGETNVFGKAANFLAETFLRVGDFGGTFAAVLVSSMEQMEGFLEGIVTAVGYVAKGLWEPIKAPFEVIISIIKQTFQETINWWGEHIVNAANTLFDPIRGALDKLGIDVGEFSWTPLVVDPALKMDEAWKEATAKSSGYMLMAKETMGTAINDIQTAARVTAEEMGKSFDGSFEGMKEKAINSNIGIMDGLAEMAAFYESTVEVIPTATETAVKEAAKAVKTEGAAIPQEFGLHIDAMETDIGKIPGAMEVALLGVQKTLHQADLGTQIHYSMKYGWDEYLKEVPSLIDSIGDGMHRIGLTIERTLSDHFASFLTTGKIDFKAGMEAIGEAGARAIGDTLSAEIMKRMVGPGVKALIDMFAGGFSDILSQAGKMVSDLSSQIGGVQSQASGIGGNIAAGAGIGFGVYAGYEAVTGFLDEQSQKQENARQDEERENAKRRLYTSLEAIAQELTGSEWNSSREAVEQVIAAGKQAPNLLKDPMRQLYSNLEEAYAAQMGYALLQATPTLLGSGMNFNQLMTLGRSSSGYGFSQALPFHAGGALPGEGWFLGLEGEGVLNRRAMGNLGIEGLGRLNRGEGMGETYIFVIQAMDGEDVERVIDRKIIPMLKEKSEAGVTVIHERGVKSA